jgi:uncharacterized protein (DUF2344 family)
VEIVARTRKAKTFFLQKETIFVRNEAFMGGLVFILLVMNKAIKLDKPKKANSQVLREATDHTPVFGEKKVDMTRNISEKINQLSKKSSF